MKLFSAYPLLLLDGFSETVSFAEPNFFFDENYYLCRLSYFLYRHVISVHSRNQNHSFIAQIKQNGCHFNLLTCFTTYFFYHTKQLSRNRLNFSNRISIKINNFSSWKLNIHLDFVIDFFYKNFTNHLKKII